MSHNNAELDRTGTYKGHIRCYLRCPKCKSPLIPTAAPGSHFSVCPKCPDSKLYARLSWAEQKTLWLRELPRATRIKGRWAIAGHEGVAFKLNKDVKARGVRPGTEIPAGNVVAKSQGKTGNWSIRVFMPNGTLPVPVTEKEGKGKVSGGKKRKVARKKAGTL